MFDSIAPSSSVSRGPRPGVFPRLMDSVARYRQVVKGHPEPLLLVSGRGTVRERSDAAAQLFGQASTDLLGSRLEVHLAPADRPTLAAVFAAGLAASVDLHFWLDAHRSVALRAQFNPILGARKTEWLLVLRQACVPRLSSLATSLTKATTPAQAIARTVQQVSAYWPGLAACFVPIRPAGDLRVMGIGFDGALLPAGLTCPGTPASTSLFTLRIDGASLADGRRGSLGRMLAAGGGEHVLEQPVSDGPTRWGWLLLCARNKAHLPRTGQGFLVAAADTLAATLGRTATAPPQAVAPAPKPVQGASPPAASLATLLTEMSRSLLPAIVGPDRVQLGAVRSARTPALDTSLIQRAVVDAVLLMDRVTPRSARIRLEVCPGGPHLARDRPASMARVRLAVAGCAMRAADLERQFDPARDDGGLSKVARSLAVHGASFAAQDRAAGGLHLDLFLPLR